MCSIKKEIIDKVWRSCTDYGFSIAYYSIGNNWESIASELKKLNPDCRFENSNLTEEEIDIINADKLAYTLGLAVSDITKNKCYKFDNIKFANHDSVIFISRYFLYIFIENDVNLTVSTFEEKDEALFDFILHSFEIEIRAIECNLHCRKEGALESIVSEIDEMAFPDNNDSSIMNSSYVDLRMYEKCQVNLSRTLRKSYDQELYELTITTTASFNQSSIVRSITEIYEEMLHFVLLDTTRILK